MEITQKTIAFSQLLQDNYLDDYQSFHLIFSDLHLRTHVKSPKYLEQCQVLLQAFMMVITHYQKKPKTLSFLGDLFDNPKPSPEEIGFALRFLFTIGQSSNNLEDKIFISGNHIKDDYQKADINQVLFSFLKNSDIHIDYVTDPTVFESSEIKLFGIGYNPSYIMDSSEILELLNNFERDESKLNLCFAHLPIKNGVYDNGIITESGVDLPPEAFDKFDLVLLGDFHTPHKIDHFNTDVYYVGSPFQFHFGHKFEPCFRILAKLSNSEYHLINIDTATAFEFIYGEEIFDAYFSYSNNQIIKEMPPFTRFITARLIEDKKSDLGFDYSELLDLSIDEFEILNLRILGYRNEMSNQIFSMFAERFSDEIANGRVTIFDARDPIPANEVRLDASGNAVGSVQEFVETISKMRPDELINNFKRFVVESIDGNFEISEEERSRLIVNCKKYLSQISFQTLD